VIKAAWALEEIAIAARRIGKIFFMSSVVLAGFAWDLKSFSSAQIEMNLLKFNGPQVFFQLF
jgi:hypothetical protein